MKNSLTVVHLITFLARLFLQISDGNSSERLQFYMLQMSEKAMLDSLEKELKETEFNGKQMLTCLTIVLPKLEVATNTKHSDVTPLLTYQQLNNS